MIVTRRRLVCRLSGMEHAELLVSSCGLLEKIKNGLGPSPQRQPDGDTLLFDVTVKPNTKKNLKASPPTKGQAHKEKPPPSNPNPIADLLISCEGVHGDSLLARRRWQHAETAPHLARSAASTCRRIYGACKVQRPQ